MKYVKPGVYHLAHTQVCDTPEGGMARMLASLGAGDWTTDADSSAEELSEVAGRLCYKSFAPGLNPNVTRVREGNRAYLGNILAQGHGSVLEHGSDTFAFLNVSRVFTHELVRHRIAGYSQESLRFVRLDSLSAYYPEGGFGEATMRELWDSLPAAVQADFLAGESAGAGAGTGADAREVWATNMAARLRHTFTQVFEDAEAVQRGIAAMLRLDHCKSFAVKKLITSAMRRMAPDGLATGIIMTTNHRCWRDYIARRTNEHAEEEIRLVFAQVFEVLSACYPSIYQDAKVEVVRGLAQITFDNPRV